MTRARLLVSLVVGILLVVLVSTSSSDGGSGGGSDGDYRFDAVFDTAQGIVPGQLVKIGGARVGKIAGVTLTPAGEARFELAVDSRFAPFHDDASCKILPEGFISESFIQCDPGTPGRPDLGATKGSGTDRPTVPLERTEASVQLQQVIDTFSMPVDERIRSIVNELGIASAGRGKDLNALLRRANPALAQTRRLLSILNEQRDAIGDATTQTDAVLAELARRDDDVRGFVDRANTVAGTAAARSGRLQAGVRDLPALLREAQKNLASLETVGDRLTPTARALARSAPQLARLEQLAQPLAEQALPSLRGISPALQATRGAVLPATFLANRLADTADRSGKGLAATQELLESTRTAGGLESLQDLLYGFASTTGPYDQVGHVAALTVTADGRCVMDNTAKGCVSKFNSEGKGQIPSNDPDLVSAARAMADRTSAADELPRTTATDLKTLLDRLLK